MKDTSRDFLTVVLTMWSCGSYPSIHSNHLATPSILCTMNSSLMVAAYLSLKVIYLGLPVGTEAFVKTFYSEGPLLPQEHRLHTHVIGFIYKQYCQSIMKFGLKFVYLRKTFLSKLDIRHNIFLKNILGIHHRGGSR